MATVYNERDVQKPAQETEVGDKFITKSRVITKTESELFVTNTGDIHPMFMNERAAQAVGWKTQLVPGLLTFSIAVGLLIQAGYLRDVIAFMGTDKVRFNAPVYPYDSIRVETEMLSKKRTSKGNWICSYSWMVLNQDGEAVIEGENI